MIVVSNGIWERYLPLIWLTPYNITSGNSVMAENAFWDALLKKLKNIDVKSLSDFI